MSVGIFSVVMKVKLRQKLTHGLKTSNCLKLLARFTDGKPKSRNQIKKVNRLQELIKEFIPDMDGKFGLYI